MADGLFNPSELYARLAKTNLLPLWSRMYPSGNADGSYDPSTNELRALAPENNREETNTLSHELTHATQYNLLYPALSAIAVKKKKSQPITPEEEQFYAAGKKLMNTQPGTVGQFSKLESDKNRNSLDTIINAMYKGTAAFKPYRTGIDELQAHGIGNMTSGGASATTKSPHLDPTMATEFSVLMDLFDRLPTSVQKAIAEQRTTSVEANKKFYPNRDATKSYYNYSNMTEDPFAPTIK